MTQWVVKVIVDIRLPFSCNLKLGCMQKIHLCNVYDSFMVEEFASLISM